MGMNGTQTVGLHGDVSDFAGDVPAALQSQTS